MEKVRQRGYSRNGLIVLCSMVYFVSYFSRKDFAVVMLGMIDEGVIPYENAGLISAMLFAFYGAGQLISGYLGDKIKPKYLILIGLAVTALCNLMMPLIPWVAMVPVWGLNGLAQAMLWPPIVKILSNYLDHKTYVTANLIVTSSAHVATVLLYVFVPICLSFMSWQSVFFTASALAIFSAALFAIAMRIVLPKEAEIAPVSRKTAKIKGENEESILSILKRSGVFTVFVCIIVIGFLRDGIETWMPTLYSDAFDRDVSESTLVSIVLPIFSIFSTTVVSALHKKGVLRNEVWGAGILFALSLACGVPLIFFVAMDGIVFGVLALVTTAFICGAMHCANFLLISCLPGRFASTGRAATVSGVCNSCVYIGAAISTYGIGLISKHLGWSVSVGIWCALLVVGVLFAIFSYKRYTAMLNSQND